eukprot:TRINITY_DN9098_c0_g1_i2.p2 TRINITY_DN9098_c0_g1~~TRINITY_DN9098_c0_g1_i2.p2  ORF type:complete len:106 (+),score=25.50 TRINITY_DN9098_c0_g1_i2:16-333(+)
MLSVSSLFMCIFFFFFKQKTAYEMLRSLVGSEMCIRDRRKDVWRFQCLHKTASGLGGNACIWEGYAMVRSQEWLRRSAAWQRSMGSYVKQLMMNWAARSASAGSR